MIELGEVGGGGSHLKFRSDTECEISHENTHGKRSYLVHVISARRVIKC